MNRRQMLLLTGAMVSSGVTHVAGPTPTAAAYPSLSWQPSGRAPMPEQQEWKNVASLYLKPHPAGARADAAVCELRLAAD